MRNFKPTVKEVRKVEHKGTDTFVEIPLYGSLTGSELEQLQKHQQQEVEEQKNLLKLIQVMTFKEDSVEHEQAIYKVFQLIISGSYDALVSELGVSNYERILGFVQNQVNPTSRTIKTVTTLLKSRVDKEITQEEVSDLPFNFIQSIMDTFFEEYAENHQTYLELKDKNTKLEVVNNLAVEALEACYELIAYLKNIPEINQEKLEVIIKKLLMYKQFNQSF